MFHLMPIFWPRLWHKVIAMAATFPNWKREYIVTCVGRQRLRAREHSPHLVDAPSPHQRAHPSSKGCPAAAAVEHSPSKIRDGSKSISRKIKQISIHFSLFGKIFPSVREKLDDIALLSDVVLPVFHEVLQGYQRILLDWHPVLRGPGLHGNQHDPRVQLFLVDLGGRRKKKTIMPIKLPFCCYDTCTDPLHRTCVFWDKSSKRGTKISHARTHTHTLSLRGFK